MEIRKRLSYSQRFIYGCFQFLDHFLGRNLAYRLTLKSRRRFYKKLGLRLKNQGKGKIIPIERRSNLTLAEFQKEYVAKGKPVVIEGVAKEWDCVKNWSLNYFKDLHGDDEIVMVDQTNIENPYEKTTLAEVIEGINKGSGKYYRFYPLLERHPEHILDFDYSWLRERRNKMTVFEAFQVFIGGDKTVTPVHNANQGNLFTQVVGEKEWRLYHHHDTAVIDPDPARNVYRDAPFKKAEGPFDPFNPDYTEQYQLYEYIDSYSVLLKAGDVLWNPPFYWHAVRNKGVSIGVGYRWLAPIYCFKQSFLYSFLDCFVTNPPVWKAYKISKQDINLIHLSEKGRLEDYLKSKKKDI